MRRMTSPDRKAAILKAALPLFARKGFAETTTKELAKAAGVSEPLLYKHFPSKEALYLAIQRFSCSPENPQGKELLELAPGAETLVQLIYFLMRALILGKPEGAIPWNTRHRLMLQSLLADGSLARIVVRDRFQLLVSKIEACMAASARAGHMVSSPVAPTNRAYFAHHVGAWIAAAHLPGKSVLDYHGSPEELVAQTVWFALRGMGLADSALKKHFHPSRLEAQFAATDNS